MYFHSNMTCLLFFRLLQTLASCTSTQNYCYLSCYLSNDPPQFSYSVISLLSPQLNIFTWVSFFFLHVATCNVSWAIFHTHGVSGPFVLLLHKSVFLLQIMFQTCIWTMEVWKYFNLFYITQITRIRFEIMNLLTLL